MALTTMYKAKPNSPKTTLAADITAAATSMTVSDATVLPTAPNLCTIGDDENAEVVSYTTISGNVVSGLIRGASGTTASPWTAGTVIARDFTSYDHDTFIDNINDLNTTKLSSVSWGVIGGDLGDQTDLQDALDLKAPLASPDLTGTPTAPTASVSTDSTQIATTAFVQDHAPIHLSITASAGSTATKSDARITASMRAYNIEFGTPSNVASNYKWKTSSGSITFTATFTGATTINFDLIEVN